MRRDKERELTPTVEEAKEWYVEGYVDDDGLDELVGGAVERREQARGEVPECDWCGEPLIRGHLVTTRGKYHNQCAQRAQQERLEGELRKIALIAALFVFGMLGLVLFVPAPPDGAIPLAVGLV